MIKHHAEQLADMATTSVLASEFIEDMPKSIAICNIALGIASTTMTDEQMQALNAELEPVLERVAEELKAVVNKHGISFSGHGAALIGKAAFPTPEDRAEFKRSALKTLLGYVEGASGSFEA